MFGTMVLVMIAVSRSSAQAEGHGSARTAPCDPIGAVVVHLPGTIQVSGDLRPSVDTMLRKSATFRSQCRQIAREPLLYVRVRIDSEITDKPYRARSTICRLVSGAIVAAIEVAPFGDPTEWLAHEFEHLIEQLERVELTDLERQRRGVWHSTDDMFETDRAIRVGRTVRDEVRGSARAVQALAPSDDRSVPSDHAMMPLGRVALPSADGAEQGDH
jgi:hypothetical protein